MDQCVVAKKLYCKIRETVRSALNLDTIRSVGDARVAVGAKFVC